jgi:hypothetical protein
MLDVHVGRQAGWAVRQEILYGKHEEERRADVAMGREAREFQWLGEAMAAGEEREKWRAHGWGVAAGLAVAREERIAKQKCEICMVERRACEWPEAHFSEKAEWVAFCNEVCWMRVMWWCGGVVLVWVGMLWVGMLWNVVGWKVLC